MTSDQGISERLIRLELDRILRALEQQALRQQFYQRQAERKPVLGDETH